MTEMEQLKKNTQKQFVEDRINEIYDFMDQIDIEWDQQLALAGRNLNLMLIVIAVQIFLSLVLNSPFWILCFLIWLPLHLRQFKIQQRIEYFKGKFMGAQKILFILGVSKIDVEDEMNKRNKKKNRKGVAVNSPFKRFKEFFERIGSKSKKEVHA